MGRELRIVALSDCEPGQVVDCFVLLSAKQAGTTRDGKPYYRVTFRDNARAATAMVWQDSGHFDDCDANWQTGIYYKVRCKYADTQYGPQIDIDRIRPVTEDDSADGFDPSLFHLRTRFDVDEMFAELTGIAEQHIGDVLVKQLVQAILQEHREAIMTIPAAVRNHHAFAGGFLEHVLSVTKTAVYLADKYLKLYPELDPPLSKSLVVAGAMLHDIGKLQELDYEPEETQYSPAGRLIGHILLGRDIVRAAAAEIDDFDAEMLLRLEHIIVAHQNLPEWGSPIAPHTPEAFLVHMADDTDAKFQMIADALTPDESDRESTAPFTDRQNALRRPFFRGLRE